VFRGRPPPPPCFFTKKKKTFVVPTNKKKKKPPPMVPNLFFSLLCFSGFLPKVLAPHFWCLLVDLGKKKKRLEMPLGDFFFPVFFCPPQVLWGGTFLISPNPTKPVEKQFFERHPGFRFFFWAPCFSFWMFFPPKTVLWFL